MTVKLASPIKTQIVKNLNDLVQSGELGHVDELDLSKDPFDQRYPKYPVALIGMSSFESEEKENQTNLRTYIFPILILQKGENIESPVDMEDLRDALANKFDSDFTLAGTAIGAIQPAASTAYTASTPDKKIIYFVLTIKAKTLYEIGT